MKEIYSESEINITDQGKSGRFTNKQQHPKAIAIQGII